MQMMKYKACIQITRTWTDAGYVSAVTAKRTTLYCVCANVQAQSSTSISYVWRIGSQIISQNGKMITASFTLIRRLLANCASTPCLMNFSIKASRTHFWTLLHLSRPMHSFNTIKFKIVAKNSTAMSLTYRRIRKWPLEEITHLKLSWKISASAEPIAHWNTNMECCCWEIKNQSSEHW